MHKHFYHLVRQALLQIARVATATSCALLLATPASAQNWHPSQSVERFRIHANEAFLKLTGAPPATCTNHGEQFRVDTTTALGRQVVATLLAAQTTNRTVTVWYINSTAPGTTETTGCTSAAIAQITGIALAQ
jgi:hypothetical protein